MISVDYKWSTYGLDEDSDLYSAALSAAHQRSAERILDGCLKVGVDSFMMQLCIEYDALKEVQKNNDIITNYLNILQNGGLYVKLGQGLVSMNHILPKEYLETLKVSL